jgi:flagellar hook-length control protein FliK
MTIETTRAPEGAKTPTPEAGRGKATGRTATTDAPGGAGGGFAGLMSSLSASDAQSLPSDTSQADADDDLSTSKTGKDDIQNMPLALDDKGQLAINLINGAIPAVTPDLVPTATPAMASTVAPGLLGGKGGADKRLSADPAAATLATPAVASDVTTLLNGRRASQSRAVATATASAIQGQGSETRQGQIALGDARLQLGGHQLQEVPSSDRLAPIMVSSDALAAPAERRDSKSATGQLRTGLEGSMGGAVADRLGISSTYEVAAASAVVPETQVAETVSYWASQGVQNAELTLDGLGNEPVEVRISVNGDQAQVDFRSNQPDVRQALEGASAQLKTMLSGEGLQLTGMSVGTSGQGNTQSDSRQPKPAPRQQTGVVSMEPVRASATRPGNPSVGRALDLYV